MISNRLRLLGSAALLAATALASTAAYAADCPNSASDTLVLGTTMRVDAGAAKAYALELRQGDGVMIDLVGYEDPGAGSEGGAAAAAAGAAAAAAAADAATSSGASASADEGRLTVCNASGAVISPKLWDVFGGNGGALGAAGDGGNRLRFVAPAAGRYIVSVPAGGEPRELLARTRKIEAAGAEANPITLSDATIKGKVGEGAMPIYSFQGTAGQWVEIKATSESDTLLRLTGPDRDGDYSEVAMNDDSDGLNPIIRRRLGTTGTYYLRIESLGGTTDNFEMTVNRSNAPAPPPPPRPLALGRQVSDKLVDEEDNRIYSMPVVAGHSYRLTLNAPNYDGYLAIGLANPLEPEDGNMTAASSFSEVRNQDIGLEGEEKMNFTARSSGTMLVLIRSFGIGDTDGSYTLKAEDMGG